MSYCSDFTSVLSQVFEGFSSLLWFPVATSLNESATSFPAVVIHAAALQLYTVSVVTLNYTASPQHCTSLIFSSQMTVEFLSYLKQIICLNVLEEIFTCGYIYLFYNIKAI